MGKWKVQKAVPDYSALSDEKLAAQIGALRTLQKFLIGLAAVGTVIFLFILFISEDIRSTIPLVAVMLAAAAFLALMAKKYFGASIKNMEAELNRRNPKNEQIQEAGARGKKNSRLLIILFVAVIVIAALIAAMGNGSGNSSGTDKKDKKDGCRNCGRSENIVAGFGYCEDCFEGFLDWQERTKD